MSQINPEEFMDELEFCLKEKDIVKAKALLQFASDTDIDTEIQKKALAELGRADENIAFPLLEYLTKIKISNNEVKDSLYELILDKAYGNTDLVIKYITQNDKASQLIYLKVAGDLQLIDAAPVLAKILSKSTDADIIIQTMEAMGALRIKKFFPLFSKIMEKNKDERIKRTAVFAIAETGGKEAVDLLSSMVKGKDEIDLIVVEALAGIQDQYALDTIASLLDSTHTHVRDAAINQLIRIGSKSVPILTRAMSNAESDYMVHLLTTLGYIGDLAATPAVLDIVNIKPKDPNIRQAAYEALERLPSAKSAIALADGLQDPVESVRMSAARAVDKNLSKVLVAGLKNIVRQENKDAANAVSALIDSEADNIFNFLLEEKSFIKLATSHISSKADPATSEHFLNILKNKNKQKLAEKIAGILPHPRDERPAPKDKKIFVVDDSKMMLKLYQNKLTNLGYSPKLFQFPEEAISAVAVSKPDLIITDLNMPDINGIELTREIRKKYTRLQLPIIMITTQSDFIESSKSGNGTKVNDNFLTKSGISRILHKPFTDEELKDVVTSFLK